jgi:predicted PurR-regulated permease PerM
MAEAPARDVRTRRSGLALAAERSLQGLLVAAALAVVLVQLRLVVLPVIAALFAATALAPPVRWLRARGFPGAPAALTVMVLAIAAFVGVMAAIVPTIADELGSFGQSARQGLEEVVTWLTAGPLGLSEADIDRGLDQSIDRLRDSGGILAGGVVSGALLVGELVAGALLTVTLLFFFLRDGAKLWSWLVGLAPAARRADVEEIGRRAWTTLGRYLRGVSIVALVDAVLIGAALVAIGVPLVVPLMVLTFVAAFIPLVGAVVAGGLAALVALVTQGALAAGLVIVAITVIQQLEGDIIYPMVVGQSIELHPVVVLLALTAGTVVAGIVGALLAIPVAAVIWIGVSHFRDRRADAAPQ